MHANLTAYFGRTGGMLTQSKQSRSTETPMEIGGRRGQPSAPSLSRKARPSLEFFSPYSYLRFNLSRLIHSININHPHLYLISLRPSLPTSSPFSSLHHHHGSVRMAKTDSSVVKARGDDESMVASGGRSSLVVCFGEMLIDFVPTVSGVSLAEAPAFKKAAGGAPANVAVGIARLGGSSAFIGKVGEDEFGHMLSNILKLNNVDNSGVRFDAGARTALAFVTLRADGQREFMFYRNPSADMLLKESELDVDLIKKGSIIHYGSISLIEEPCRSTHLAALEIAKQAGCILSYDPNLRLPLWPSSDAALEGIKSIWEYADVIKVSEEEISFLTGGEDPYSDEVVYNRLFHPNLKLLVVTEGQDGCRYYTKKFHGKVGGFRVKAVDTTGAGDSFVSGLLTHLASYPDLYKDEKKLKEALAFANACGAITVTERGAIPALPTKAAVLDFIPRGDDQPPCLCAIS